jgi:hypothetical protein
MGTRFDGRRVLGVCVEILRGANGATLRMTNFDFGSVLRQAAAIGRGLLLGSMGCGWGVIAEDYALFHDEEGVFGLADVLRGIAGDGDHVGKFPGFERANLVG